MTLGATELRAYGMAHGVELAKLAQRDALRRGDAHRLLFWSERWRATALAVPEHAAREDRELAAELEALRSVTRLLETDRDGRLPAGTPWSESGGGSRQRCRPAPAGRRAAANREQREREEFDLDALFDELGESTLIEIVEVDGVLHVIIVADRRLRLHPVGGVPGREVQLNRFVLRRLAHGPPQPGDELVLAQRHQAGVLAARLRRGRAWGRPGRCGTAGPAPGLCRGRLCRRCAIAS